MKIRKPVFMEGHIVESRVLGETCHPFCIHSVAFSNGKYAIVREASGVCFQPGDTLERNNAEWFFHQAKIHLLPFQYIKENESHRLLSEYET